VRVVGSVIVHNEDIFVEQAIRNVAAFCDRIHVVDHMSTDRTWEILSALGREFDHLDLRRARHARVSHAILEPYFGSETWVMRVDGDELYDPALLPALRTQLEEGGHADVFRVQAKVLHCIELDRETRRVSGHLSPPSRPINVLYNMNAVESWTHCGQRLIGGRTRFRPGFGNDSFCPIGDQFSWDEAPLRCLHVCFLRRSTLDTGDGATRLNMVEMGSFRRGIVGDVARRLRGVSLPENVAAIHARGSTWKREKYMRGDLVTVDATPFFRQTGVAASLG
jgi:glycosyltransferase involved in cell wall biosynthesis